MLLENTIHLGDCLELMKEIQDASVDMILCDLPYGTTDCKWDAIIPVDGLWEAYRRVLKPRGAIVLTACQPFTSRLVMSNVAAFKTAWVWNKKQSGGFATAKFCPLKVTEDVLVFGYGPVQYHPIMRQGKLRLKGGCKKKNEIQSGLKIIPAKLSDQYYPTNIIEIVNGRQGKIHPTQKPVELFEYLIKTYTNPGDLVLDNCAGSGTTAVACKQTGRRYLCIEKDREYWLKACERVNQSNGIS